MEKNVKLHVHTILNDVVSVEPVSYTHLDVYKRQSFIISLITQKKYPFYY